MTDERGGVEKINLPYIFTGDDDGKERANEEELYSVFIIET